MYQKILIRYFVGGISNSPIAPAGTNGECGATALIRLYSLF